MRNTIIITVVLFLAVIAASIYYFRDINNEHHDNIKPLKYLPENTLLIASIKNDEVTDNIFKDFELFDAILGFDDTKTIKFFKNNILRNEVLKPFIQNSEVYISFHTEKEKVKAIFTIPTSDEITESDFVSLHESFSKQFKISQQDTLGHKIMSFSFGSPDTTLHTTYYESVLFASYSKELLTSILDKSTKRLDDEQVNYFIKNNSRNTPLSVYFPHQQLPYAIKHFQRKEGGKFLDQFAGLDCQSAWNINFKQDALMLTGESELENTSENYLAVFRHQTKTTQNLYNYFPAATAVYMEYSFSNSEKFQADLSALFEARGNKAQIKTALDLIQDKTSPTGKLRAALGKNFALIEQVNQTNLGFVHVQDTSLWKSINDTIFEHLGDSILRFKNANLLFGLYGDAFKDMSRPYVTRVENTLVFANSSSVLQQYLADYRRKDLLTGTLGFKNFEKLQGNEANVTLFIHTKNANSKILNSLPQQYQSNFRDKERFGFQDFYSWSVQLAGNNGNFSSQIYAIYKSKNALGSTPEWTYSFDNKAITRPYIFEHSDTSKFILIQELDHTIHAIHPSGQKMWSAVFAGRVVGDIQQLDDRTLLLVTDRNMLYRFDTEGKTLKGFSKSIPDEPIAEPTLLTLNGDKVMLIPTGKNIYAYDMDGNRYENWEVEELEDKITTKIHITVDQKILIGTSGGWMTWLDLTGKIINRLRIPSEGNIRAITEFSPFKAISVDNEGRLNRIREGVTDVHAQLLVSSDKFLVDFEYITSSSTPSLVLINPGQLKVFNIQDSLKEEFAYNFTKNIENKPQFFSTGTAKQHWIGVSSRATNLVYVFGENGGLVEGFPVEGQPLFYYGKINYNSDTYLLCMRRDHKLYAFRHQK